MDRRDNYAIQTSQARQLFLEYSADALTEKLHTPKDTRWLHTAMLSEEYRISRSTGCIERLCNGSWIPADSFSETLTLFDLVCDSSPNRFPSGTWKDLRDFGLQFHQNLVENTVDPWALRFQDEPEHFRTVCESMGGKHYPTGDLAYVIPFFEELSVLVQLWFGDDEFPPKLRWLWDSNALMYLRYETMYYAIGLMKTRFEERLKDKR